MHLKRLSCTNFVMDKSGVPLIKYNGKNYTSRAFKLQIYLKGKELWGHIDGSDPEPTNDKKDGQTSTKGKSIDDKKDKKTKAKWEIKDAQIMRWILGSVESQFILHLRPYKTA